MCHEFWNCQREVELLCKWTSPGKGLAAPPLTPRGVGSGCCPRHACLCHTDLRAPGELRTPHPQQHMQLASMPTLPREFVDAHVFTVQVTFFF